MAGYRKAGFQTLLHPQRSRACLDPAPRHESFAHRPANKLLEAKGRVIAPPRDADVLRLAARFHRAELVSAAVRAGCTLIHFGTVNAAGADGLGL